MMDALNLKDRSQWNRWVRYAVCGKYAPLEKVHKGRYRSKEQEGIPLKKAG